MYNDTPAETPNPAPFAEAPSELPQKQQTRERTMPKTNNVKTAGVVPAS
jgi:hypothetical protein